MKFRIKYVANIGYFGQAQTRFFSGWKTIGKHPSGYGLYQNGHAEYPLETHHEALERCKLYEQWAYHNAQEPSYFYL